jgi:6-phosphogluconolactonase (cycloisomerase 2 family)
MMRIQGATLCSVCLMVVSIGGCSSGNSQPKVQQGHFLYTNDDIPKGFGNNTVSGLTINSDGSLSLLSGSPFSTQGIGNGGNGYTSARRIAITSDGKFLFAANDGSGDISSFSVDSATGNIALIAGSPFSAGGDGSEGMSLALSPDGRFLYVSNTNSSNISILRVNNGRLQLSGAPVPVTAGTFPADLRVTPDGKYLVVTIASLNEGLVGMYKIAADGSLSQVSGSPFSDGNPPGGSTEAMDMNCAGDRLFIMNNSALPLVDVFRVGSDGALSQIPGSPYTTPGGGALYLSPDESHLFVAGPQNVVSVFNVATDGSLALVPASPFAATGGTFLGGLVTDPASKFLYVAGYYNRVVGLQINTGGNLSLLAGSPFTASPLAVAGVESLATYPPKTCTNP